MNKRELDTTDLQSCEDCNAQVVNLWAVSGSPNYKGGYMVCLKCLLKEVSEKEGKRIFVE